MIFKSLHNKLLNKKIEKSLSKLPLENRFKPNPIKTLACIIDPSFPISVDNFIDLSNYILKIFTDKGLEEKMAKEAHSTALSWQPEKGRDILIDNAI